jgi:hypothetical protein
MTALVPAAAAPPGGPAGLLDAERLHAAMPGLAVVVRWTRTGSLRFAWSEVTSHVERDLVEATIWSGDPAESPVYGVIDGWSALFDLAGCAGTGPSAAPAVAPGPALGHAAGKRAGLLAAVRDAARWDVHGRIESLHGAAVAIDPDSEPRHGRVARFCALVTQDAGGRRSTRCALDEPATLTPDRLLGDLPHVPAHEGPLPDTVVLGPQAFAELLAEFASIGLCVRDDAPLRAKLGGHGLSIVDDPAALGGWPFDIEGMPSGRLQLVRDGCVTGLGADRAGARRIGVPAPGRALRSVTGLWSMTANLVVDCPSASEAAEYLFVERVHYVSVLDAMTGMVTCATRDTTTVVRAGRPVAAVPTIRLRIGMPELLRAIRGGLGPPETVQVSWGGCVVRTPAIVVSDLPAWSHIYWPRE